MKIKDTILNFGINDGYRVLNMHVSLSVSFVLDLLFIVISVSFKGSVAVRGVGMFMSLFERKYRV